MAPHLRLRHLASVESVASLITTDPVTVDKTVSLLIFSFDCTGLVRVTVGTIELSVVPDNGVVPLESSLLFTSTVGVVVSLLDPRGGSSVDG